MLRGDQHGAVRDDRVPGGTFRRSSFLSVGSKWKEWRERHPPTETSCENFHELDAVSLDVGSQESVDSPQGPAEPPSDL